MQSVCRYWRLGRSSSVRQRAAQALLYLQGRWGTFALEMDEMRPEAKSRNSFWSSKNMTFKHARGFRQDMRLSWQQKRQHEQKEKRQKEKTSLSFYKLLAKHGTVELSSLICSLLFSYPLHWNWQRYKAKAMSSTTTRVIDLRETGNGVLAVLCSRRRAL
ncbi:hypothetical protein IW261DRAFT_1419207 [Armillaria novae-zelandiae]|uniref:Uncharacterized protein n=1 Tax=Armillaria novae-zelandiae TaxID=153914 RepID=A0AA39PC19_9AGAR|nr:hypothetical protein IW261DRAFT_1419207 [Armillaria novae-zelandiae]